MFKSRVADISDSESTAIVELVQNPDIENSEKRDGLNKINESVAVEILGPDGEDVCPVKQLEECRKELSLSPLMNGTVGQPVCTRIRILKVNTPTITRTGSFMVQFFAKDLESSDDKTFNVTCFSTGLKFYAWVKTGKMYVFCGLVDEFNNRRSLKMTDSVQCWVVQVEGSSPDKNEGAGGIGKFLGGFKTSTSTLNSTSNTTFNSISDDKSVVEKRDRDTEDDEDDRNKVQKMEEPESGFTFSDDTLVRSE